MKFKRRNTTITVVMLLLVTLSTLTVFAQDDGCGTCQVGAQRAADATYQAVKEECELAGPGYDGTNCGQQATIAANAAYQDYEDTHCPDGCIEDVRIETPIEAILAAYAVARNLNDGAEPDFRQIRTQVYLSYEAGSQLREAIKYRLTKQTRIGIWKQAQVDGHLDVNGYYLKLLVDGQTPFTSFVMADYYYEALIIAALPQPTPTHQ